MTLTQIATRKSEDGSVKIGLKTKDSNILESICLPREKKVKVCISSQIGCGFSCLHCKTGTVGFVRNLTPQEMFEQASKGLAFANVGSRPEIIYFGAGEPFLNFKNVIESMRLIKNKLPGFDSYQQLQASTSGVKGKILDFANLDIRPQLAISLHSAISSKREFLIPQSKGLPLTELRKELEYYLTKQDQRVIIHYSLIKDFNDDSISLKYLVDYLKGLNVIVYVIPFNPYQGGMFSRPNLEKGSDFVEEIKHKGIAADFRPSRGRDVGAACGQLTCDLRQKIKGSIKHTSKLA